MMKMNMADQLRELTGLVDSPSALVAELERIADEWDRLAPVRDAAQAVLMAVCEWYDMPGSDRCIDDLASAREALEWTIADHLTPAPAEPAWIPSVWRDVRTGDRVRLPGTDAKADVEMIFPLEWMESGECEIRVKLAGRDSSYTMRPHDQIEVLKRPSVEDLRGREGAAVQMFMDVGFDVEVL